ncbi:MAG: 50S ribosomal protein L6 [Planctomycetes bacterium]|nr:50S ribosomal protein L6 [Planctomycetota bacterium]
MSRLGKKPVSIPKGVNVAVDGRRVKIKGPKGEFAMPIALGIGVSSDADSVTVTRSSEARKVRAMHGTTRANIACMLKGVSEGYLQVLEIEGVGYNAAAQGANKLVLKIGFNADRVMLTPEGVSVATPKNTIINISGADKQKVGQFAAEVRGVRPPEPYKGKGIRYAGEKIIRKVGKAVGGKG